MPEDRRQRARADLPEEFTPETIRRLPISVLRQLTKPGNGVLGPEDQASFDAAVHTVMSDTARRVSGQINRSDWPTVERDAHRSRRGGPGRTSRADEHLRRMATRIDRQLDVAEDLAPDVDWSFAPRAEVSPPADTETTETSSGDDETVADFEDRLTEQVELIQVMSEIADVSKRTYALEKQRDLQTTRGVFFGFVVSVAVLVAGWAPVVAADDWAERVWILCLTVGTCVLAAAVYALVRMRQNRHQLDAEDQGQTA